MFPATWTPYVGTEPADQSPCPVDIVGKDDNINNYALFWGIDNTDISFRMRLNGDPRQNQTDLESHVWGVQIVDAFNAVRFIVRVIGKQSNGTGNRLEIYVPSDYNNPIYSESIVIGTNVIVTEASPKLYGQCGSFTDYDYLLDFKLPVNKFTDFDFRTQIFKLCFFTGTSDNTGLPDNFKEEPICGPFINQQTRGINIFGLLKQ